MAEFSVIVPIYNNEAYLDKSVGSVLAQTLPDWELILVDDGSRDGSPALCDAYAKKDSRIRCIHKPNEGVAIARKVGLEHAGGDYIVFLDSDDWIEPDTLASVQVAIRRHHPDIVVFPEFEEIGERTVRKSPGPHKGIYFREKMEREIFPYLLQDRKAKYYTPTIWGNAFRREILPGCMIADSRATIGEDGACLIAAVWNAQSMFFLGKNLYHYRHNAGSATNGHRVIHWDNAQVIAEHIERCLDLDQYDFREQQNRKIVHDLFLVCISRFYAKQPYRETAKEIRRETGREFYQKAIRNARFSGRPAARWMHLALKWNQVFLIWLYSRFW